MEEIAEINKDLNKKWQHWHFKNTSLLILSLVIFFLIADTPYIRNFVEFIGSFGYIGAFLVGIMFVSVFTIAPASVVLFYLAKTLDPIGVALAAGTGGVVGDYLILKYLKDRVFEELKPVFLNHGGRPIRKLFRTPYFVWAVPILGAIFIMSPVPDEVGIGLLGVSKVKAWKLFALLYLLDIAGILLIVVAARSF